MSAAAVAPVSAIQFDACFVERVKNKRLNPLPIISLKDLGIDALPKTSMDDNGHTTVEPMAEIDAAKMTVPAAKGCDSEGRSFVAVRYEKSDSPNVKKVDIVYQVYAPSSDKSHKYVGSSLFATWGYAMHVEDYQRLKDFLDGKEIRSADTLPEYHFAPHIRYKMV